MKILTIREVAKILKINHLTAYKYAIEGKIPAIRLGRNWKVHEGVLQKWLIESSGKIHGPWKRRKPEKIKKHV